MEKVWDDIKGYVDCGDCPLKNRSRPLLFDGEHVNWVKVMVITEGPNEEADRGFIASIANHPTFTFLQALFKGNFKPYYKKHGGNTNVYWTHVRKCFLKTKNGNLEEHGEKALKVCAYEAEYLRREIEALKPKLIVAVGKEAIEALLKYSGDNRLQGNLRELIFERRGIFNDVKIGKVTTNVIVVPHPSGRSKLWVELAEKHPNANKILEEISSKIIETLQHAKPKT